VVLIITVFAAVALPTAVTQLRDRRVQEAARRFGMVYREARMRALGRGSAVLVRIVGGTMTVFEAQVGVAIAGNAGCATLPVSSCLNTDWNVLTARRVVDGFSVAGSGEFSNLTIAMSDSQDNAVPNLDICFTPMGRAFERRSVVSGDPFAPIANAYVATLSRPGGTRARQVVLMPNGSARMFTQ
jgi:type II secretory pathway pseudopilin PulG